MANFEQHRNNTCSRAMMVHEGGEIHNIHYGDILTNYPEIVSLASNDVDCLSSEGEAHSAKDYVQDGDIIIADTAEDEMVGKMIEIQDVGARKVLAGLHTVFYRPPTNLFVPGWLGYWMNSNAYHNQLLQYMTGTKVLALSKASLAQTVIYYPSKEEQKKIVIALETVQKQISNIQSLLAKYESIKKATVKKLMTPECDWEDVRLGDVCQIYDGTHQTPHYVENGVPFYSVENVTADDFVHTKYITIEEHLKLTAKQKIEKNNILMTRIGSIGVCKLVDWDVNASYYVSLALLKCSSKIYPQFLVYLSETEEFISEVQRLALPLAIPQKINLGPISNIHLRLPSLPIQKEISMSIKSIHNTITQTNDIMQKMVNAKLAMLQYFFGD